jgi:hypothetical protein
MNHKNVSITSICADVVDFALPREKCVFYLLNPFKEQILDQVIINIHRSFVAYRRKMYLIYVNAQYRERIERFDFLVRRKQHHSLFSIIAPDFSEVAIYETHP